MASTRFSSLITLQDLQHERDGLLTTGYKLCKSCSSTWIQTDLYVSLHPLVSHCCKFFASAASVSLRVSPISPHHMMASVDISSLVPIRCRECSPSDRRRFKIHDKTLPTTSGAFGRQNHQSSHSVTLCNLINIFSLLRPHIQMLAEADPDVTRHEAIRNASQNRLQVACAAAQKQKKYNSADTRQGLTALFAERFGSAPYDWQLDVTEALLLGLDSVVIAGTGSGKTIPFMLPLLQHPKKMVLIISPLKVLQRDQVGTRSNISNMFF